jgi:hypothetical protein
LIEGEPMSEKEKNAVQWLEEELMNGGLEEKDEENPFLLSLTQGKDEGEILFRWIQVCILLLNEYENVYFYYYSAMQRADPSSLPCRRCMWMLQNVWLLQQC